MFGFLPRSFLVPASAISKGIDPVYAFWHLGMMNGLFIIGRIGIGLCVDRFGPLHALSASFICCAIGHSVFWVPGVGAPSRIHIPTALFTLFVVFVGVLGSGFISLFPVVVAHSFGKDALASKIGLLSSFVGVSTLAGPSALLAILGEGHTRTPWIIGTFAAGLFMFVGGCILLLASKTAYKLNALLGTTWRLDVTLQHQCNRPSLQAVRPLSGGYVLSHFHTLAVLQVTRVCTRAGHSK